MCSLCIITYFQVWVLSHLVFRVELMELIPGHISDILFMFELITIDKIQVLQKVSVNFADY